MTRIVQPLWLSTVALLLLPALSWANVNDGASVFSPEAVQEANKLIAETKERHKLDITVQTFPEPIPAWKDKIAKASDRDARGKLFQQWAIDQAESDNKKGVFILVNMKPGYVQTVIDRETRNRGFGDTKREEAAGLLRKSFGEAAKAEGAEARALHDKGLLATIKYIHDQADSLKAPGQGSNRPGPAAPFGARADGGGGGLQGLICMALVGLLGLWLVIGLIRAFSGGGGGGMGGGGGFMSGLMGGLFGAMAGAWMYNSFFGGGMSNAFGGDNYGDTDTGAGDFSGDDGSGGGNFGGGDYGGGGDFGGGDFGGDF
jgi:uncharacterized protein